MDVKALLEDDLKISAQNQMLVFNGIPLSDNTKSLKDAGVKQDDIIMVAAQAQPQVSAAERARNQINGDPNLKRQFLQVIKIVIRTTLDWQMHSKIHSYLNESLMKCKSSSRK